MDVEVRSGFQAPSCPEDRLGVGGAPLGGKGLVYQEEAHLGDPVSFCGW